MKNIISIFFSLLIVGTLFLGCGNKQNENSIVSGGENPMVTQDELTQDEKAVYKEKVKKALDGIEINDLTILTQNETKQPIVSVQAIFNETKGNANKNEIEKFIKDIKEKIESVSKLYEITIIDKNSQIIAMTGSDNEGEIIFL